MNKIDLSFNNEFELQLEKSEYKWFKDNWKNSLRGFQKRFNDEKGIKYFITGYHYNHSKQLNRVDIEEKDSYTFDVQFILDENNKHQCVDISFSADFLPNEYRSTTTLQEVEEFYEKTWINLGCPYYELND